MLCVNPEYLGPFATFVLKEDQIQKGYNYKLDFQIILA
jgi:hypothetical protein